MNHNRTPGHSSQKNENLCSHTKKTYTQMFIAVLFIIVKNWEQPCPDWWVVKPTLGRPCHGVLPKHKEQTTDICEQDLEKGQSQKITYYVMPFMWYSGKDRVIELEHRLAEARVKQRGGKGVNLDVRGIWGTFVAMEMFYMGSRSRLLYWLSIVQCYYWGKPEKGDKGSLHYLIQLLVKSIISSHYRV